MEPKLADTSEEINIKAIHNNIFDLIHDFVFILDKEGKIIKVNKAVIERIGYTMEELFNKSVLVVHPPEKYDEAMVILEKMLKGEKDSCDIPILTKDGRLIPVETKITGGRIANKDILLGISRDMTEYKINEEALILEKNFTETALNAQRDTFFVFDPSTGKPIRWNKAFNDITRYSDEEVLNLEAPASYYSEDDLKKLARSIKLIEQGKTTINEANLITKDGSTVPFEYVASGIFDDEGNLKFIVAIGRNITERMKTEQKVEDLARFPSENPNPILRATVKEILYANHPGKGLFNIQEGSEVPEILKEYIKETLSSYESQEIELELENRAFSFVLTPIKETGYVNIYGRDISERKKTEQQLIESEEKFRSIFEAIPDLYFLIDKDTKILDYRGKIEDLYISQESLLGNKITEVMPIYIANLCQSATEEALETKEPQIVEYELIIGEEKRNFEARHLYNSKDSVSVFIRDITKRKRAEELLKESEENYKKAFDRANFYKDLFAHDMNNVLSSILLSIDLISETPKTLEKMKSINELFNIIKESTIRGAKLISNVQKLSKLDQLEYNIQKINVITFLNDAKSFIKNNYPHKNIEVQIEPPLEEIYINGNELLLDVFENIMINAVKYNNNQLIKILIKISEIQEDGGSFLKLEFLDNGMGIEQYRKEKIFEVGNREYKGGRGMGLGLSLVRKIVESYNGKILVEDKVSGDYSKGSNFIVLIPKND